MKITLLALSILLTGAVFAQEPPTTCNRSTGCPPVGGPIISTCFADIEKTLAHSMDMPGLARMNSQTFLPDGSGGTFNCNDPVATAGFVGFPHDLQCEMGGYSPDRYCMDIENAVSLGATLLLAVGGLWGWDDMYTPGSNYMIAAAQAVTDINNRYDCAGKRRPVIGASILEHVDESVRSLAIPASTINAFQDEIASENLTTYYIPGKLFNVNNICTIGTAKPSISNLEARMYFYYLACKYIDMGYGEITPDYISACAVADDPTGYFTHSILSRVRAYAASKGKLLIIGTYLPTANCFYNGNLMFDFRFSAVRPQEVNPVSGPPGFMCSKLMIDGYGEASRYIHSGISPYSNCDYSGGGNEQRIPFLTGIDWHVGVDSPGPNLPISNYAGRSNVWGYDEARYFTSLSHSCEADYLDYVYETSRAISHRGFFSMPNRLICKNGRIPADPAFNKDNNGAWRLAPNTTVYQRIANDIWHVNQSPSYTITAFGCLGGQNAYLLTVNYPDESTVYTWHVQNPNGSWQPYTYGVARMIIPLAGTGTYTIQLRCDNWAYTSVPATGVLMVQQTPTLLQFFCRETTKEDKFKCTEMEARVNSSNDIEEALSILKEYESDPSTKAMSVAYLEGNGRKSQLEVYPNPAHDEINILSPDAKLVGKTLKLVNTVGVEVKRLSIQSDVKIYNLKVNELPRGLYYLYMLDKSGNTVLSQKVTLE